MKPSQLFLHTSKNSPSAPVFREIGKLLVDQLRSKFDEEIRIVHEGVEPSSWVTNKVIIADGEIHHGGCYFGVVSYSLQDSGPSINAVLLKFNDGQRLVEGSNSILTSKFLKTGWEDFIWDRDVYSEWECDHTSEIVAVKK